MALFVAPLACEVQEHLTTALTMYRTMDMRFWLDQAEAIMGALP